MHAWGHDRLAKEEQWKFSQATFGLVVDAVEGCGNAPEERLRLVPHMMANFAALTGASNASNRVTEALLGELEGLGGFITDLGRWVEVGVIKEFVLSERMRVLGDEHPYTIMALAIVVKPLYN